MADKYTITREEALLFHRRGRPGKIEITPTKPLTTQRDLSLAYSPGVAEPCLAIAENPDDAYEYTAKGNIVAVISNGTAVLGLGNLGALGSKPVMEGKAVLFKKFADVDGLDIEVDTTDVDEFIAAVRPLEPTFGGINLEDIKAPECFIIENALREAMDIPVFHDDQHGTAIIAAAGIVNAAKVTGRKLAEMTVVVNGAGAAGIACVELIKALGVKHDNVILCDTRGAIYKGRESGMNQWKSAHAAETDARTLEDALVGADVFLGLSVKGAVTQAMVEKMAPKPIIFGLANPDPEITPEEVKAVRPDAICATGRSDYPNQVNNVLGFPYIFRGALDVRARTINEEMKVAAVHAIAQLAREDVPDEVARAYGVDRLQYGPEYILPVPFDPRLIYYVSPAVAKAAMDTGVARRPIVDMTRYKNELKARLDPMAGSLQLILDKVRDNPKKVVFAEGEEEKVIRAAHAFKNAGFGYPILVGNEEAIKERMAELGLEGTDGIEISNSLLTDRSKDYIDYLYNRLQRRGYLYRDCQRMINRDRNVFGAAMVAMGDADAIVTGLTRNYASSLENIRTVFERTHKHPLFGLSMVVSRGKTIFIADTAINEQPSPQELAEIAIKAADVVNHLGQDPRVAMLSYSTFGNPVAPDTERMRDAVAILDDMGVTFEYEGEISAQVALSEDSSQLYPFSRLTGPANVLIMPNLHAAAITTQMLQSLGDATVVGPLLIGLEHPAKIVPMGADVSDLVNIAALATHEGLS